MADKDLKLSSADSSDREGDTFEDAPDMTSQPSRSSASTRSLTDRPLSSSSTSTPRLSTLSETIDTASVAGAKPPDIDTNSSSSMDLPSHSPLLTTRRLSTSSLDEVQLEDANETSSIKSRSTPNTSNEANVITSGPPPKLPFRSQGLSGNLPAVPWGPPPPPRLHSISPAPPPKKLSMPFSWLSRSASANKDSTLPSSQAGGHQSERRSTVTSITSNGTGSELNMSKVDEGNESDNSAAGPRHPTRNSLRDRFKMVRMREEAGIHSLEGVVNGSPTGGGGALAGLIGRGSSVGFGIASPTSVTDEKDKGLGGTPTQSPSSSAPSNTLTSPTDPNLAPVDWDLWQSVVYEGPAAVARSSAEELNHAIASGIPSAIRGVVWQVLAQSKNEELEGVYRDLVVRGTEKDKDNQNALRASNSVNILLNNNSKEKTNVASSASSIHSDHSTPASSGTNGITSSSPSQEKDAESIAKLQAAMMVERRKRTKEDNVALQKLEKQIKKDMGARTSYSKYAAAAGLQDGLFGVCKAYALFDEGVGYAQGMNFLVMPLLFNMPEEEAFCLLVRLMNQYHLRDMFIQDMPGLHLHLYQFERLLEDLEPALYCHLHRKSVSPQLYATQWFLTLFAYRLPLQLVVRVYDLILSEGLEGAILKFGIVLMQKNATTLLSMNDMSSLMTFLKERLFDVYIDQAPSSNSLLESGFFGSSGGTDKEIYRADVLVQDACAVKIAPELLKTYTVEWDDKVRVEKDREAELELLRSSNASLSLKVRSLEERTEKSDSEHVQMASELVRTKVENEELRDGKESLEGQVEELKNLVERQPGEVEERLMAEMDRIMKRNLEVQNENRGLEEQMADMEKVLVETKMQLAEINSEHEGLKQKWNDLRRAIES
ncbi:GTPase-activating protein [Sticta canariensis]|nr:GTPase-activating protein [Sticta canariensis]